MCVQPDCHLTWPLSIGVNRDSTVALAGCYRLLLNIRIAGSNSHVSQTLTHKFSHYIKNSNISTSYYTMQKAIKLFILFILFSKGVINNFKLICDLYLRKKKGSVKAEKFGKISKHQKLEIA
jgi:hypothetical protein